MPVMQGVAGAFAINICIFFKKFEKKVFTMWQKCVIVKANVRYAISSRCIFPLLLRIESEKNRS